jgi:hypothetical protein
MMKAAFADLRQNFENLRPSAVALPSIRPLRASRLHRRGL